MKALKTVETLKNANQDFEWYPTTAAMIQIIRRHMMIKGYESSNEEGKISANVLDCGAGDGRVLAALVDHGERYAIEKSTILLSQQPADVIPVATDFNQSTLIDKKVDVIFSNPPYSQFEAWAVKIIKEANAPDAYLIIPERWSNSEEIKAALETRKATATIIHTGDFLDAERSARAKINILHIDLRGRYGSRRNHRHHQHVAHPETDPFNIWFAETFPQPETSSPARSKDKLKEEVSHAIVQGRNMIDYLVELYQHDMQKLATTYRAACQLDPDVIKELEGLFESRTTIADTLRKAIRQRIAGLKHLYWHELFSNYESITTRLTTSTRRQILDRLHKNVNVDFSSENAYAITLWVIRNANQYYDSQLIELVESMTKKANIALYKSNQRTFKNEDWRYSRYSCSRIPEGLSRYKLEYRIVLESMGGIYEGWSRYENPNNLNSRSHDFITDVLAVAKTLGWHTEDSSHARNHIPRVWESNKPQQFTTIDGREIMAVKAFKNGNLHIKFNQQFMKQLNVEFGRLKGWLKDKQQAADELKIKPEEVKTYFNSTFKLQVETATLALGFQPAQPAATATQKPTTPAVPAKPPKPTTQLALI